jgi:hypothetical protein
MHAKCSSFCRRRDTRRRFSTWRALLYRGSSMLNIVLLSVQALGVGLLPSWFSATLNMASFSDKTPFDAIWDARLGFGVYLVFDYTSSFNCAKYAVLCLNDWRPDARIWFVLKASRCSSLLYLQFLVDVAMNNVATLRVGFSTSCQILSRVSSTLNTASFCGTGTIGVVFYLMAYRLLSRRHLAFWNGVEMKRVTTLGVEVKGVTTFGVDLLASC